MILLMAITDTLSAPNGVDFDASELVIVADSLDLISQATGMAATITGLFSTISFISETQTASIGSGMSNYQFPGFSGSKYTIEYYHSSTPITFNYGGSSYSFYAPLYYLNATSIVRS